MLINFRMNEMIEVNSFYSFTNDKFKTDNDGNL